jgi:hypothetical protein
MTIAFGPPNVMVSGAPRSALTMPPRLRRVRSN